MLCTLTLLVPCYLWLATAAAWAALTPEQIQSLPPAVTRPIEFTKDIQPILEVSCTKCHGRGKDKGGFRLDTRESLLEGGDSGPAVALGKSGESYLIELVAGIDPDNVMPQKGSKLTPQQVSLLRGWIDQNAPWDATVSFAKPPARNLIPRRPELPPAHAGTQLRHPVDLLLQSYFAVQGITPGEPVADRTFARRAYLDAIGLLPTSVQLEAFLQDSRPDKRKRLVDDILGQNQAYAEHWLTFWNDALRNDYKGTGYIDDGRKQISSWLYAALARNIPYDRFVSELIDPSAESEGFVKGIVWRGVVNASQTPQMQAAQNISQVVMGVNLKCASCHDSFINDWSLADAYGLASVYADQPLEMFHCDKPTARTTPARFIYPELGEIPASASRAERQKVLAGLITHRQNGRLARTIVNRLWAKFMGRGLVEPLDDMEQAAWHVDLLDWLAEDLVDHDYDLKRTIALVLTSRAYQLPAVDEAESAAKDFRFAGPLVRRLSAEQFRDALAALTATWHHLPATEIDFTAGRTSAQIGWTELMPKPAQWIWSTTNSLTKAKPETVYFRRTVELAALPEEAIAVATADNSYSLYVNGHKAASGKDYNKPQFIDLRPHLRVGTNLLAIAAVNDASPKVDAAAKKPADGAPAKETPDPEAGWNPAGLFFYARLRHHDQVWDVSSDRSWEWSINKTDGWEKPGFSPTNWTAAAALCERPMGPWQAGDKIRRVLSVVYVRDQVRSSLVNADPLSTALGRPPREQVVTSRPSLATTLQALELTNGETLSQLLAKGAKHLLTTKPATPAALVKQIYVGALGREPTSAETELGAAFLGAEMAPAAVEDFLWSVAMLPEFQLIY